MFAEHAPDASSPPVAGAAATRMRIAIWHNLPSGGGKRALHAQVAALTARGHHVEAWSPPTADLDFLPLASMIDEHVVPLPRYRKLTGERFTGLPRQVERALHEMEVHARQCADEIRAKGFDLVVAHPCKFFRTSPIARFVDIPSVMYLQEPYRWLYEALPRLPWLPPLEPSRGLLGGFHERRVLHNVRVQGRDEVKNATAFDRILVNSLFSRESVLRCYGLEADVCYLGTDLDQFADRGLERVRRVVGLGSITPEKNVARVIEAIGLIDAARRPSLTWIGNIAHADHLDAMHRLATRLGVLFEARVGIGDDEVVDLLNRSSVMAYAPRLEPFGLAPIEAAACGLPVVGVAEGGVRETIVDGVTGFLVAPGAAPMADAIGRLLDDPALARRFGLAGRSHAEQHWSARPAADRIEAALAAVVRERART